MAEGCVGKVVEWSREAVGKDIMARGLSVEGGAEVDVQVGYYFGSGLLFDFGV